MNNGRHDPGLALHQPFYTGGDGPAYHHATYSPYLYHPVTPVPVDLEHNRSSEEVEELDIEYDGEETENADHWMRDTTAQDYRGTAGPYLDNTKDTTQATYLFRTHLSSPRRPYLGRSHAPNPACLLSRYRVPCGAPNPLTDPDTGPGGSTRRPRRPEDIPNDEIRFVTASRRPHIAHPISGAAPRLIHHSSWSRQPALNGTLGQGGPPSFTSRTVQGVPILERPGAVGNYNLRPRGSSSTSSSPGCGHRRESSSRSADSNGLLEETEVESQSRKRRRAGPGRCPTSASALVPGPRSRPTSLQGILAPAPPVGPVH